MARRRTSGGVASREAALGVGALRSADPGDLSAALGVPWAALALGTAGLRGLLSLGVGGVPAPPFFSFSGLPLLFASAEPDLRSGKPNRNQTTENNRLYPPRRREDPPHRGLAVISNRNRITEGEGWGHSLGLGALHCCAAAAAGAAPSPPAAWCASLSNGQGGDAL